MPPCVAIQRHFNRWLVCVCACVLTSPLMSNIYLKCTHKQPRYTIKASNFMEIPPPPYFQYCLRITQFINNHPSNGLPRYKQISKQAGNQFTLHQFCAAYYDCYYHFHFQSHLNRVRNTKQFIYICN